MHQRINFSTLPFVVLIFDGKKCHAAHGHAEIEAGGESGARTDELYEILLAQDETGLVDCLRNWDRLEPLPQLLFEPLSVKCRHYHTVGGLPEAVSAWCEKRDLTLARERQRSVIELCRRNARLYANPADVRKIERIEQSLSQQLTEGPRRFRFSAVEPRTNARKYGSALEWLVNHRMVRRVYRVSEPGVPLSDWVDPVAFRLYFADVGLFSHLCGIEPALRESRPELFPALWKSLADHFVLQSLAAQLDEPLRYWSNPKPQTSVDFLANLQGTVVPIAVDVTGKSRAPIPQLYRERYGSRTPLCVRFSWRNLGLTGNLLDIPFFLADEACRLMLLALEMLKSDDKNASPA